MNDSLITHGALTEPVRASSRIDHIGKGREGKGREGKGREVSSGSSIRNWRRHLELLPQSAHDRPRTRPHMDAKNFGGGC
jgi:hypothetical protein